MGPRLFLAVLLPLLAVMSSGCVGISGTSSSQATSMGPVKLTIDACAQGAPGCSAASNGTSFFEAPVASTVPIQLLVAIRLPLGAEPPAAVNGKAGNGALIGFQRSASYEAELEAFAPAPAGERWWGWLSGGYLHKQSSVQSFQFSVTVQLPRPADGGPHPAQLRWRPVVGARTYGAEAPASRPVDCGSSAADFFKGHNDAGPHMATACADSPSPEAITGHLDAPVTDFGLTATPVAAAPGTTTVATFLARRTGEIESGTSLALAASGGPAGATLSLSRNAISLVGDAITPVQATVTVPAGTPAGDYPLTLTATAPGKPSRTATAMVTVTSAGTGSEPQDVERPASPHIERPASPDTTAPVLSGSLTRKRFRAGAGTTLRLASSEGASLQLKVERLRSGRRSGGRCRTGAAAGKRCTMVRTTDEATHTLAAGNSSLVLGKKLKPGSYRVSVVATDAAGNRSNRTRLPFRVVRR